MYAVYVKKQNGEIFTYADVNTISVSSGRIILARGNRMYTYRPKEINEIKFCWQSDKVITE